MNLQENINRIKQMMGVLTEDDNLSISDMVKLDQEMRQEGNFDVNVDFKNQKKLKELLGDNPQEFLEKLDKKEDVEGVWLIAQHADNNLELQKQILDLLDSNKEMLSQKFNIPIKEILYGIAMLTDRIMVNKTTGIRGYRDNDMPDFSEILTGKQKYGSQGGVYNNNWVPRPIEINNEIFFFETPEELYDNEDFLEKINKLRNDVGLPPLEDYVRHMQKYSI